MSDMNQHNTTPRRRSAEGGKRAAPQHSEGASRSRGKKQRSRGAKIAVRIFQVLGTLLLIGVVTGSFLACYAAVYIKTVIMPDATLDLSAYTLNENSVVYYYDENGQPVELQTLVGSENREWVDYEDIPQDLINAFIAIEDKRFWDHDGVDWYRTAGAFVNMFLGMRNNFGGSTLTQQLVKNLTEYDDVTVKRKIIEIFTALDLEKNYKKEEILTYYFNEIFMGSGCYGVQSAAQMYFGKDVSELSLAECASLAGITNNPSLYSPYSTLEVTRYKCTQCGNYSLTRDEVCSNPKCGAHDSYDEGTVWTARDYNKARQELILYEMWDPEGKNGVSYITQEQYEQAIAEPLVFRTDKEDDEEEGNTSSNSTIYSWYVEAVIDEVIADLKEQTGLSTEVVTKMVYSGGLSIYVPYDPDVQAAVDAVYNDQSNLNVVSKTGQQLRSAITIVDNTTGYVVALAGDVGEKTINRGWNYAVDTVRQPGSSIKPLSVYSPALELGLITPATVVDDNPRLLNGSVWPLNMPRGYKGLTTVLDAVTRSVNTVAVNVLEKVTPQTSYEFMTERYGITTLEPYYVTDSGEVKSDIDTSPLAMGGLTWGVSTFEMAAAYATFPRGGDFTEATTYLMVKDNNGEVLIDNTPETKENVISDSTAYYINSMLTNVVSSGTGTHARIPGQTVAGKTGTTDAGYDLWFVGYTTHYTAAVWTGYPNSEVIQQTWPSPSVTLWQKVMKLVHQNLPQESFAVPGDLVRVSICADCGKLATEDCANDLRGSRVQTFSLLKGDGPTEYCTCHVPVKICTESPILDANGNPTGAYYLACEHCPEESVKEVTMVDYDRELVTSASAIEDYYALMSIYDGMEDPNCPLHKDGPVDPDPDESGDPEPGVSGDPEPSPSPDVSLPPEPSHSQDPEETEEPVPSA